jgi:hypothetical protein
MQTIIHTIQGTFIVPSDKQAALIHWLQENAVRSESVPVREQVTQSGGFTYRQLINEGGYIGD